VQDVAELMASLCGNDRAVGEAYNVAGSEVTSIEGCIRLMAKAVGVEPNIVHVPMDIARRARPPLLHWGEGLVGGAMFSIDKALRHLDWAPQFGLLAGYQNSYEWFDREGRDRFDYDWSGDDDVLAQLV
jgi:nucleoside-diphosphate-sugar epimerase